MNPVHLPRAIQIGDVFIQGGFPGHAVTVVDLAKKVGSNKKIFLLAQSYMPAQDIHVLKSDGKLNPWYELPGNNVLETPEWTFKLSDLKRFSEE
jgi:Domain of unknown function (4846)